MGVLYSELAKWERHRLGHSLGVLNLSHERLWFDPHRNSILEKGFDIPLSLIHQIERSDNWLWRGAVNIPLSAELRIQFDFRVNVESLVAGLEEPVFSSTRLRLFLGFTRKRFLQSAREFGLIVKQ